MITEILNEAEEWIEGTPTIHGQLYRKKIPAGNKFGYEQLKFNTTPIIKTKLISMSDFGELLPDAVIVELEDFRASTEETPGKRQAAARVLLRIASSIQIDAHSDKMTQLLTKLVTHTSLTTEQATAILDALKD